LYEAGADTSYLKAAEGLLERTLRDFGDAQSGAFFNTARDHETLLVRTREGNDGAIPNGNAVAARALARLAQHLGRDEFREAARAAIRAYGRLIERSPRSFSTSLSVVDFLLEPTLELVLVGTPGDSAYEAMNEVLARRYLPNRIQAHIDPKRAERVDTPLTEGKASIKDGAAAYICRNFACDAPVSDAAAFAAKLDAIPPSTLEHELSRSKLTGCATAEGTERLQQRSGLPASAFTELANTKLKVSRFGFGGYRVSDAIAEHKLALEQALTSGVNLVDTSTNYTDGQSERLIGDMLGKLARAEKLARDEVVLVSKIGYVQAKNLEFAQERERQGSPFPEMVKYGENVWHSIHPEWIEEQLTRSLSRLSVETLDVCLLHNPEYFFSDAVKRGQGTVAELRTEFYRRVTRAFEKLEAEVERGRISYYGVSSNTLVAPHSSREATDLASFLECARTAGGDAHHFRVVQAPMNLLETAAMTEHNTGPDQRFALLELAQREHIAVLVNRPLNAIVGGGISRLSDPPIIQSGVDFAAALRAVGALEDEFRTKIAPSLRMASGTAPASDLFTWGEQLKEMPARAESLVQWQEIEAQVIGPQVSQVLRALDRALVEGMQPVWQDFRERYVTALDELLNVIRERSAERSRQFAKRVHEALASHLPDERQSESLSKKALWVLSSVPGITSVLVGARKPEYVAELTRVLGWEQLTTPREAVIAARTHAT
jgi:aryl-alcohol dehydrogenase-like predicted oxidoreductase